MGVIKSLPPGWGKVRMGVITFNSRHCEITHEAYAIFSAE